MAEKEGVVVLFVAPCLVLAKIGGDSLCCGGETGDAKKKKRHEKRGDGVKGEDTFGIRDRSDWRGQQCP